MKIFGSMAVFLLSLLVLSGFANAGLSFDYFIERVEIDNVLSTPFSNFRAVDVERGKTIPIDVWVNGLNKVDNVRVEVSLKGYEHGVVSYTSDIFELDSNTIKKIPLVLELPSDLDASETYTLNIEVSDKQNSVEEEHFIRVKEKRHLINVLDVIFRPSANVEAGRFLRSVIRVENLGGKTEKDIKVSLSIPELGVSTRDFVDELVPLSLDDKDTDSSLSTNELVLQIPKDAKEGDYTVRVDVEYNRGNDLVTLNKKVHVTGKETGSEDGNTIISIDSTNKQIKRNEDSSFRLMFANLGESRNLYNVEIIGADTWADTSVEPGFLSVGASEAGELLVKLKPKENAVLGSKVFTLKVKSDNKLVKEINLNADVTEGNSSFFGGLRTVLEGLFVVLIVVLIVLALIIAFRKLKASREEGPGVETNTEQTYY